MLKKLLTFIFISNFIFAVNPLKSVAGVWCGVFPGVTTTFGKNYLKENSFFYPWFTARALGIATFISKSKESGLSEGQSTTAALLAVAICVEAILLYSDEKGFQA